MGKTQVRATLLATTAVLMIIAANSASANLLSNPGFQNSNVLLAPWVSGGTFIVAPGFGVGGSNSAATSCAVAACVVVGAGVTGTGTITQSVNLAPGIYQASFAGRSFFAGTAQVASSLGARVGVNTTDSSSTFKSFSFISAAAGGPTNFVIGVEYAAGGNIYDVDNASLVMVDDGEGNNIAAAAQTVAVQASREFLDRLQDRFNHAGSPIQMASVRETVLASAGDTTYVNAGGRYRAFMSVFGSDGEWDDSSTSSQRRGLSAGIEFATGTSIDVGVAFSLSRSDFDTRTIFTRNDGEASEYLGAVYAHWSAPSMPVYLNLIAGYGQSNNDFTRTSLVGLGAVRAQDVDSSQWFGSAELGFDWALSQNFTLTPFARIDGATIDQDGYSEVPFAGALLVPAVVAGRDFDAARSVLGLRAALDLDIGRGAKLGGKVGWAHEFEQDRFVTFTETTGPVTFAGVAGAATPAEDAVVAGASLEIAVSERAALYAGYNGDFADEQEIHAGEVGLRVTW